MTNDAIDYFEWLLRVINIDDFQEKYYRKLLTQLHETEFYSIVNNDENRVQDGLRLRDEFRDIMRSDPSFVETSFTFPPYCSMLEMMVAFAKRIEDDIMWDPYYGDRTGEWFWLMVDSLGLMGMTDEVYDPFMVRNILEKFVKRSENVSLFPITNAVKVSQVELWYQMNYYFDSRD